MAEVSVRNLGRPAVVTANMNTPRCFSNAPRGLTTKLNSLHLSYPGETLFSTNER